MFAYFFIIPSPIMLGCIFITFMQPLFFIIMSWSIAWHDFIVFISLEETCIIFMHMASAIILSCGIALHEAIMSVFDIFDAGIALAGKPSVAFAASMATLKAAILILVISNTPSGLGPRLGLDAAKMVEAVP